MLAMPSVGDAQRTICETTVTETITRYYVFGVEVWSTTTTTTTTTCIYHNN